MTADPLDELAAEISARVRELRLEEAGIPLAEAGEGVAFEHLPAIDRRHWRQLAQAAREVLAA